jgi:hypothetical protein
MASDLLGALTDYLENAPTVQAVLTDPTGLVAIFDEVAITGGDRAYPYAGIVHYDERDPGESLDDGLVSLTLAVFHDDLDSLRAVAAVLKDATDSVAINPGSVRTAPLAWDGGRETGVVRYHSRPRKTRHPGPGGVPFVWREDIDYEFTTTPE